MGRPNVALKPRAHAAGLRRRPAGFARDREEELPAGGAGKQGGTAERCFALGEAAFCFPEGST